MPVLTITPDSAFGILLLARQFDVKVPQTDPDSGSNPSDDGGVDAYTRHHRGHPAGQ